MLIIAILIICLAHIIRVFRWELLIETYERPNGVRLTKSLSLGYFLNYFLPFKAGDLARAVYAGSRMQNGRGFALATVIVERCLDVIVVGAMFVGFSLLGIGNTSTDIARNSNILGNISQAANKTSFSSIVSTNSGYYISLGIGVLMCMFIVYALRKYIKRTIYIVCGLLNEKYEEKLLRFFWALIWGFKDILSGLPKLKLVVYTILMWGLYLCSYGAFSVFLEGCGVNRSFSDVFFSLFDQQSLLSSGLTNGFNFDTETIWYAMFLLIPPVMISVLAILWDRFMGNIDSKDTYIELIVGDNTRTGDSESIGHLNLIPQANTDERRTFLKMYFAGEKKEYIENYLKINRNILVLRDYSAGSNATTILCTDGEKSFYRKYAFQEAADKLADQIDWLKAHENVIPVADTIREDIGDGVCYYDMPYYSDAVTLFEYSQSGDKERAWDVIKSALEILEKKLYTRTNSRETNESNDNSKSIVDSDGIKNSKVLLEKYIDEKVTKNLNKILNDKSLSELLKYDTIIVNGREYNNLKKYEKLFTNEKLTKVWSHDKISEIHGDLTIENIICKKDELDFYLIDPNTGNIFDSKFIDYAKLLQSLHGKYEFLMAVDDVTVNGNRIDYKFIESETYTYLYNKYSEYIRKKFKPEEVKSIYYHEIANWFRLMPYKLEKGRGVLFYTGLLKILDDLEKITG